MCNIRGITRGQMRKEEERDGREEGEFLLMGVLRFFVFLNIAYCIEFETTIT